MGSIDTIMKKHLNHLLIGFAFACTLVLAQPLLGQETTTSAPAMKPAAPSGAATPAVASNQTPKTPAEFFARAKQLSDLEAAGVPFHLKATFVATGDAEYTGNGTYEEWWQSKNVWRKEATLGSYKYVAVRNGTNKAASATMVYTPLRVRQVERLLASGIKMPSEKNASWIVSKIGNGPGMVSRVVNRRPCNPKYPKLKKFLCTQACEFTERGTLQSCQQDDLTETYRDFRPFEKLIRPGKADASLQGNLVLTANVSELDPLAPEDANRFDLKSIPTYGTKPAPVVLTPRGDPECPKLIDQPKVKYPKSELDQRRQGIVVVVLTIDTKGDVREPFILRSAGAGFDQTVLNVIHKYKYKPILQNGQPALGETSVEFDFSLRHTLFGW